MIHATVLRPTRNRTVIHLPQMARIASSPAAPGGYMNGNSPSGSSFNFSGCARLGGVDPARDGFTVVDVGMLGILFMGVAFGPVVRRLGRAVLDTPFSVPERIILGAVFALADLAGLVPDRCDGKSNRRGR